MKVQEEKEEVKSKKFRRRKNQDMKVKEEREEIKKVSMVQGFTESNQPAHQAQQVSES